ASPNVRKPKEPGLRERYVDQRRNGEHLARVREADEPALPPAHQPETGGADLRGSLREKPRSELLLEDAKIDAGGLGHRRLSLCPRSSAAGCPGRWASLGSPARLAGGPRSCRSPGSWRCT